MKLLLFLTEYKNNKTNCLEKKNMKNCRILDQIKTHVRAFLLLDQPKITIEKNRFFYACDILNYLFSAFNIFLENDMLNSSYIRFLIFLFQGYT